MAAVLVAVTLTGALLAAWFVTGGSKLQLPAEQGAADTASGTKTEGDPYKMGFEHGYFVAGLKRSSEKHGFRREEYDDDYHGTVRMETPARMARFRAGYRDGYRKAWDEQ